ncbi:MAG TPA: hopanoid-associated sugar epimerase [Burkholderiaceae bacterium]|nr:hopanoid-associated sugar epimerase [Burkholderiaceae bacterium]
MVDLAFVTGASGFVGSAVARALLAAGWRVRALVRPTSPRSNLDLQGLQIVEGDMRDERAVAQAVAEARYVFHVAADYRLWAPDPGEIVRNNVEGTRIVLRAAQAAGVERIVYTSSVATLRLNPDGAPADEAVMLTPDDAIGAYKRSKVAAESLALQMAAGDGLPLVIVNPSTPIGPRDVRPTPTGRIIVEAASGRMPAFVDTGLNLVHVDDVAAGHLLALTRGRIGQRYILGGENVTLARMLEMIAGLVGRAAPRVRLPRRAIYPIAFVSELIARFTGREPFATLDGLRMARYRMYFTSAKAHAELGYTARPSIEALKDAVAWFRQAGMIR